MDVFSPAREAFIRNSAESSKANRFRLANRATLPELKRLCSFPLQRKQMPPTGTCWPRSTAQRAVIWPHWIPQSSESFRAASRSRCSSLVTGVAKRPAPADRKPRGTRTGSESDPLPADRALPAAQKGFSFRLFAAKSDAANRLWRPTGSFERSVTPVGELSAPVPYSLGRCVGSCSKRLRIVWPETAPIGHDH